MSSPPVTSKDVFDVDSLPEYLKVSLDPADAAFTVTNEKEIAWSGANIKSFWSNTYDTGTAIRTNLIKTIVIKVTDPGSKVTTKSVGLRPNAYPSSKKIFLNKPTVKDQ